MDTIITPVIESMTNLPAGTKVYAGYVPQDPETEPTSLPFIVTQTTTYEPLQTMCNTDNGGFRRILVTIVARESEEVTEIANNIRDELMAKEAESTTFENDGYEYDGALRAWVCQMTFTTFS